MTHQILQARSCYNFAKIRPFLLPQIYGFLFTNTPFYLIKYQMLSLAQRRPARAGGLHLSTFTRCDKRQFCQERKTRGLSLLMCLKQSLFWNLSSFIAPSSSRERRIIEEAFICRHFEAVLKETGKNCVNLSLCLLISFCYLA